MAYNVSEASSRASDRVADWSQADKVLSCILQKSCHVSNATCDTSRSTTVLSINNLQLEDHVSSSSLSVVLIKANTSSPTAQLQYAMLH